MTKYSTVCNVTTVSQPVKRSLFFLFLLGSILAVNGQIVSGNVTDAISGKPIAGAAIHVSGNQKVFTSDSTGTFTSDTLAKGTYAVRAEMANYLAQSKTVVIAAPKDAAISNVTANFALYNISTNAAVSQGPMILKYFFPGHNDVEISIYDESNKLVRKAFDRTRKTGTHEYSWDGKDNNGKNVAPGTYISRINCGNLINIQKVVIAAAVEPAKPQ